MRTSIILISTIALLLLVARHSTENSIRNSSLSFADTTIVQSDQKETVRSLPNRVQVLPDGTTIERSLHQTYELGWNKIEAEMAPYKNMSPTQASAMLAQPLNGPIFDYFYKQIRFAAVEEIPWLNNPKQKNQEAFETEWTLAMERLQKAKDDIRNFTNQWFLDSVKSGYSPEYMKQIRFIPHQPNFGPNQEPGVNIIRFAPRNMLQLVHGMADTPNNEGQFQRVFSWNDNPQMDLKILERWEALAAAQHILEYYYSQ